jgi:hypothetical protein
MGAAVNRRLVLGDEERALDQIEHLPPLHPCSHRRIEKRLAMAAGERLMPHDGIEFGDLPERFALVAALAPARLAEGLAKAARDARLLLQPVAPKAASNWSNCLGPDVGATPPPQREAWRSLVSATRSAPRLRAAESSIP